MAAILNVFGIGFGAVLAQIGLLLTLTVYSSYGGGCNFPDGWNGSWFQSGNQGLIAINSTRMQNKGECAETDGNDKFLVYDKVEDCYRCLVIHQKHKYVLQYKETYCTQKDSLSTICDLITGDDALYSMFRKDPAPVPQPCPFHPAPFTFSYNRGHGDCSNPPSRAESCTDDSRLLLRYMSCPDVSSTESNVEELVCLATWKEGSTRYMVGQIAQVTRRSGMTSDEDSFRCFIYKGQHNNDKVMTYNIAMSGDATCNGIFSPTEGSRTMKLTNSDDEHNRCHFPSWIVDHHKWYSLDHVHQYHFTTKNATLKVMNENGSYEEKRLVCHSILEQKEKKHIKLVAHVTRGCESGHVCLKFHRRDGNVLELQQGAEMWESAQDACSEREHTFITLIPTTLQPMRCPIFGRYSVVSSIGDRRRRRQQAPLEEILEGQQEECTSNDVQSVSIGCGAAQDTFELKSACTSTVYTCHGSWSSGGRWYLIAGAVSRGSSHARAMCVVYTTSVINDTLGTAINYLSLTGVNRSCDRMIQPGTAGDKKDIVMAYNLTLNGTCEQSSKYNSFAPRLAPAAILVTSLAPVLLYVR